MLYLHLMEPNKKILENIKEDINASVCLSTNRTPFQPWPCFQWGCNFLIMDLSHFCHFYTRERDSNFWRSYFDYFYLVNATCIRAKTHCFLNPCSLNQGLDIQVKTPRVIDPVGQAPGPCFVSSVNCDFIFSVHCRHTFLGAKPNTPVTTTVVNIKAGVFSFEQNFCDVVVIVVVVVVVVVVVGWRWRVQDRKIVIWSDLGWLLMRVGRWKESKHSFLHKSAFSSVLCLIARVVS